MNMPSIIEISSTRFNTRISSVAFQAVQTIPHYLVDGFFRCFRLCFLRFTLN